MTKIVDLQAYRTTAIEQKAFTSWHKRFGESYGARAKLSDLSDKTLCLLALHGEGYAVAFYELIMGVLGLGEGPKFYYLNNKDQMMVMDIHLFLADQVRFEMMHRLGWLTTFPGKDYTLLEMVLAFEKIKAESKQKPPALSASHPEYSIYTHLPNGDKQVFIRRRLTKALEAFSARLAT